MKWLIWSFLGALAGISVFVLITALVLFLVIDDAHSHDQINVNVRDKHTHVQRFGHDNEAITDMLLIFNHDQHIPIVTYVDRPEVRDWCTDSNNYLRALKALVDDEVAKAPEFKETYQVSYDAIERAWCK